MSHTNICNIYINSIDTHVIFIKNYKNSRERNSGQKLIIINLSFIFSLQGEEQSERNDYIEVRRKIDVAQWQRVSAIIYDIQNRDVGRVAQLQKNLDYVKELTRSTHWGECNLFWKQKVLWLELEGGGGSFSTERYKQEKVRERVRQSFY